MGISAKRSSALLTALTLMATSPLVRAQSAEDRPTTPPPTAASPPPAAPVATTPPGAPPPAAKGRDPPKPKPGKFKIEQATFQFNTSDAMVTAGVSYRSRELGVDRSNFVVGLTGRFPSSTSGEDANTDFDQFTSSWRAGLTLAGEFLLDGPDMDANLRVLRLELLPELGLQDFFYFPQAGNAQSSTWHTSEDITADALYFDTGSDLGVQATYRAAFDWMASPSVGVIAGTAPALVTMNKVISDAVVQPSMLGRLFVYKLLGGGPFAVGPTVALSFVGPRGNGAQFNQTIAGRAELWLYYHPGDASLNMRIGIAPYLSDYFRGSDSQARTLLPGVLFQIRYGGAGSPGYSY